MFCPTAWQDSFFHRERRHLAALELRRSSLQTLGSSASSLGASIMQHEGPVASTCVQRTLDSALAASRRHYHQTELAALKMKFELPLAYKGCVRVDLACHCYAGRCHLTLCGCLSVADAGPRNRDLPSTTCQWWGVCCPALACKKVDDGRLDATTIWVTCWGT